MVWVRWFEFSLGNSRNRLDVECCNGSYTDGRTVSVVSEGDISGRREVDLPIPLRFDTDGSQRQGLTSSNSYQVPSSQGVVNEIAVVIVENCEVHVRPQHI